MFNGWQAFYQVTGSAAGALIGLLFIVATLSAGRRTANSISGGQLFTGPTVFHLALVLMISALALMPVAEGGASTLILCLCVLAGLAYSSAIALRLSRMTNPTHWTDVWYYGVAPVAAYLGLSASTAAAMVGWAHAACAVAVMVLVLLMLAIRNAWDLVTFLAARAHPVSMPSPQDPS
ncbi:MAG: hypothetical protein ACYDD1_07870 [Caulobacteraceae bacterium]